MFIVGWKGNSLRCSNYELPVVCTHPRSTSIKVRLYVLWVEEERDCTERQEIDETASASDGVKEIFMGFLQVSETFDKQPLLE